jgi:hypothetical protein
MPHRKRLTKLTGDLHPPEVESDFGRDADEPAYEAPTVVVVPDLRAEGAALLPELQFRQQQGWHRATRPYLDAARGQVRAHPVAALVAAFALGLVLARI